MGGAIAEQRLRQIVRLLGEGTEVIGLKLSFRDHFARIGLPPKWHLHVLPACLKHKAESVEVCRQHAGVEVERILAAQPEGALCTCPFGFTEIVAPVFSAGLYMGPVFAGPCWLGETPPPEPTLFCPPSREWLERRLGILRALSAEIGRICAGQESPRPRGRRAQILEYLGRDLSAGCTIHELAAHLNLSPSRTNHLVQELFGTNLPLLLRRLRIQAAAAALAAEESPISEIAYRCGYDDQNYFSRVFRRHTGLSPREYRKRYATEV